jgi:hypothetical protein
MDAYRRPSAKLDGSKTSCQRTGWPAGDAQGGAVMEEGDRHMNRTQRVLLGLLLCVTSAVYGEDETKFMPVVDTPIGRRVFSDLGKYYTATDDQRSTSALVPYKQMIDALLSRDAQKRQEAGDYLHALFQQTWEDDRSGRSPYPSGMPLGGGPSHLGESLRGNAASDLASAELHGSGEEVFKAACWLYRQDRWPDHNEAGIQTIARIRIPEADKILCDIVKEVHGNFDILILAIEQIAKRKLSGQEDAIRLLCTHYHPKVREAATLAAKVLEIKEIEAYRAVQGFTARLDRWLRQCVNHLPDRIPLNAPWRRFRVPNDRGLITVEERGQKVEVGGWLVDKTSEKYRVVTWFGEETSWDAKRVEESGDSLPECATRFLKTREQFNALDDDANDQKRKLEESHGISRFMSWGGRRWGGSLPEILVAAWSYARNDLQTAAALLFPLLQDEVTDEQLFLDYFRDELAIRIDKRMLQAFTGAGVFTDVTAPDYREALRLAQGLSNPWFDGFEHQGRAKRLAAQLPGRLDDFRLLQLPSEKHWPRLQSDMGRKERIEYLVKRIRLLQCQQQGVPGGIEYDQKQYRRLEKPKPVEPSGPWKIMKEVEPAVNPYIELLRTNLTGNDVLQLVPYLESQDYILAYDIYRFTPNNPCDLHKVNWVVASIMNAMAQKQLVNLSILEGSTEKHRKRHLDEIKTWCRENENVSHVDFLSHTLLTAKDWQDARFAFWELMTHDESRAVKAMYRRGQQEPNHREPVIRMLCLLDRNEYAGEAFRWMKDAVPDIQFWGALLVLRHADPNNGEAVQIVVKGLREAALKDRPALDPSTTEAASGRQRFDASIETLLAVGSPETKGLIEDVLSHESIDKTEPSLAVLQRLFLHGHEPACRKLLKQLDDTKRESELFASPADALLSCLVRWRYDDRNYWDVKIEDRPKIRDEMKKWIHDQFERIRKGENIKIHLDELNLPWGDWKMYSSGWIRRI